MPDREETPACPVCFSEFDSTAHSPSTLPCSHTFCGSCLRHPSLAPGGRLRCPICRSVSWGWDTVYRNTESQQEAPHTTRSAQEGWHELLEIPFDSNPARLPLQFPPWPVGVSVMDEAWFVEHCALCCRAHPGIPYMLECGHTLCPGCLRLLLALASPGWVTFLYCPLCRGQTAVFQTTPATAPPAAPERRPSVASVTESQGERQDGCCGVRLPCALL